LIGFWQKNDSGKENGRTIKTDVLVALPDAFLNAVNPQKGLTLCEINPTAWK
jgi:hypothetical protein